MSFDSEDDYEFCSRRNSLLLPFDVTSIENIILMISDKFDFRVIMNNERTRSALLITTGLALAGGLIGKHYGGKVGAAIGGTVGGACGLGVVAISMREIWEDIKFKLTELFELVYDYLAGLGIEDYQRAALFLTSNSSSSNQLGMLMVNTVSQILGKKILTNIATNV